MKGWLRRRLNRGRKRCLLCCNGLRGIDQHTDEELAAYAASPAEFVVTHNGSNVTATLVTRWD
jgi:hypothetical protein